jgi:hypothetical protein
VGMDYLDDVVELYLEVAYRAPGFVFEHHLLYQGKFLAVNFLLQSLHESVFEV